MKRKGEPQPDKEHKIVGHVDDDEWNCRRENLTWVTPKKNRAMSDKANESWSKLQNGRKTNADIAP